MFHKIQSVIIVFAMVLGLCAGFVVNHDMVSAADAFETSISGFPDSYKPYLRTLHNKYPNWKFVPYNTGIKFKTAVDNEYKNNRSLIENSFSKFLKSNLTGDYNAATGAYIPKDGGSWVTASKNAIAYFMDPRNFLDSEKIYMFEQLSFDSSTQTQTGVEAILDGSFMHNTNIGYLTNKGKYKATDIKYSAQIMEAARNSKVSAYYIASKIIQEIGRSKHSKYAGMGASGSVTGQYSTKYKGIYNFYNIGAYSGSNPIANGLSWASSGSTYSRPWNTPMKSINGGAVYIGEKYINCGQNTIYYQRFNVNKASSYGLYEHQYMTNIYGAASEAGITSEAYISMGIAALPKTFVIPVYKSMPSESATVRLGNSSKTGVVISAVNLRKGASTGYKTLLTLAKGDIVTVTKGVLTDASFGSGWLSNPYWYKVTAKKNGKTYTGYLAATYININKEKDISKGTTFKLPITLSSGVAYYMSDNPAIATVDSSGNVTGIKPGTVTVRAFTPCGSMSAMTIMVTEGYAPDKPIVKGASKKYNSVKLTWNAQSGVSRYYIYKKNASGKYQLLKIVKGTVSSYIDTKLITGQMYYYKVKACRIVSGKKYKSKKSASVKVRPVPGRPKKPLVVSNGSVTVKWNKISGASGYKVYRSTSKNGKYKVIKTVKGKANISYKDTKVSRWKTYYYKVAAYRKVSDRFVYGKKSKIVSIQVN